MRKLLISALFLVPVPAFAAAPPPAPPPPAPAPPAVSVTVPAISVTVPPVSVKVPAIPATSATPRQITTSVPAAGLQKLALTVRVGALHITSADTDSIKIKVRVEQGGQGHFIFTWTSGTGNTGPPASLHLVAHRSGDTLTLCLSADSCEDNGTTVEGMGGWQAQWELVVPRRFHVTVNGGVLDTHVRGIAGGLDINIGVGKLSAFLPRGPVSAKIGVGKLDVAVASSDYGPVHLATGVGDARFTVGGKKITSGYQHEFTSSSQDTTGNGKTAYDLKAGTGAIVLALGAKSPGSANSDSND